MAYKTGNIIPDSYGYSHINTPYPLGITMGANEYPKGSVDFTNIGPHPKAFWYDGTAAADFTLYLCDSNGGNAYKLFDVAIQKSQGTYYNTTVHLATGMDCPGLKGKSLYIKSNKDHTSIRNSTGVNVDYIVATNKLTVRSADTNKGTVSPSGDSQRSPNEVVSISASPKAHYHFTGWTKDYGTIANASAASTTFTMPSQAAVVTANFAIDSHTVSISAGTGGSVNTNGGSWEYGSAHAITATENSGYRFVRWQVLSGSATIAAATNKSTTLTVAANASVMAVFEKQYTISSAVSPSGTGTATVGKAKAYAGEIIEVGATPATGYELSAWTTSVSGTTVSGNKFTMPASDITVTAVFQKKAYGITVNAKPSSGGTPASSKYSANLGDSITLSDNRAYEDGYVFDGWSSEDVTITGNVFTMPAKDVSVTGNYHIGTSAIALDRTAFSAGETAVLTITAEDETYYHKYRMNFGPGMDTGFVTVSAGVNTVPIYIPLEWGRMLQSAQRTGGTLTVKTFEADDTPLGENVIDNLSYTVDVIPRLRLTRADEEGAPMIKGVNAKYQINLPAVDSFTLRCGESEAENPPKTGLLMPGDTMTIPTDTSVAVELEVVFGYETFTLTESVPSVWLMSKSVG